MSGKWSLLVLAAALLTTIAQVVIYAGQLPDEVASHFGANGRADGSMSRTAFLVFFVALQFGLALMMVGIGFLMSKLPPSLLNIPNKEYWLHEDRKDATIAFNQSVLNWIAAATAIFMVVVFQMTIQANIGNADRSLNMPVVVVALVLYLCLVMGLSILIFARFSNVPAKNAKLDAGQ